MANGWPWGPDEARREPPADHPRSAVVAAGAGERGAVTAEAAAVLPLLVGV